MGNPDDKERHYRRRKKNIYAKILKDSGDHKGAFSIKVVNPKKGGEYKRSKIDIRNIDSL